MSDKKTKPKYNMWQNTGYMVKMAWENQKPAIFVNLAIALLAVAQSLVELYLPPVILDQVEHAASLKTLATTILMFTAGLAVISGVHHYFSMVVDNANYGMRKQVLQLVQKKMLSMSFPLTENPRILALQAKAYDHYYFLRGHQSSEQVGIQARTGRKCAGKAGGLSQMERRRPENRQRCARIWHGTLAEGGICVLSAIV